MIITHNIHAMNTERQLSINKKDTERNTEKLSSGYRINRAADDAACLSISEKMRAQIRGLNQGSDNCMDGISLLQVADGALNEVNSILNRLKELSVQSANDTYTNSDRAAIQDEVSCLLNEVDRIGRETEFNTRRIFFGGELHVINVAGQNINIGEIPFKDINLENISLGDNPFSDVNDLSELALKASLGDRYHTAQGEFTLDWNLIYGNGSTSQSGIRVKYGDGAGNTVTKYIKSGDMRVTGYSFEPDQAKFTRTISCEIPEFGGGFDIEQSVSVVSPEDADYKYYELSYTVTNRGNREANVDFMFHADTAYNNNDRCEGYFLAGNRINENCLYTSNADYLALGNQYIYDIHSAGLSDGLSIVDVDAALPFSENIRWGNQDLPDIIAIGNYYNIRDFKNYEDLPEVAYQENGRYGLQLGANTHRADLGISMLWSDTALDRNASKTFSFSYGITAVDTDKNLKDVPIKKYTGSTMHVEYMNLWLQSASNARNGIVLKLGEMNTRILGINGLDVSTQSAATEANAKVDKAINKIALQRASIGAFYNRLEHSKEMDDIAAENLQLSESRMRDLDLEDAIIKNTCNIILTDVAQTVLAQANQEPKNILQLLQ